MKSMKWIFAIACLSTLVASAFAQNAETKRNFGYIDSKTGMFHPMNRTPLSDEILATISPTSGKFVFNVTITVSSALPTTALISCAVDGFVDDLLTGDFFNDVEITAKRVGNTATCTLTVPYEWYLGQPAKDIVEMDLTVVATAGTSGTTGFYEESFSSPAITMAVPPTGTTTTKAITTTI